MKNKHIIYISIGFAAITFTAGFLYQYGVNKHRSIASTADAVAPVLSEPSVLGAVTAKVPVTVTETINTPTAAVKPFNDGEVYAKSYLVFDLQSGQNLFLKRSSEKTGIASLTKLMTAYVAYQNVPLDQTVTTTLEDMLITRPSLQFPSNDRIKLKDFFNSMLVGSCNDAALALANHVGYLMDHNFIDLMNTTAAGIGMVQSNFSNPLGFDSDQNYSTAEDLKLLVLKTQKIQMFADLGKMQKYNFVSENGNLYSVKATNKLIGRYPDISAIKSGLTPGSEGSLISRVGVRNHQVVIIVLNSDRREADTLLLKKAIENNVNWEE